VRNSPVSDSYDIIFLGGGPAGYQGAIRAAQLGAKVAVIEEKFLGGICLNWGCIPTKTVRASAEAARTMRRAKEFGFKPVEVSPDIATIMLRKERIVSGLRASVGRLFQANRIALVEGRGRLIGGGKIEVKKDGQTELLEAPKIVIATGSRPANLPVFPPSPRVFPADEMLNISWLPSHLLVVGGGMIGVEMAAVFRELGSQVTIVEIKDRILPAEDAEMAAYLQGVLKRRKIEIICSASIETVSESERGVVVTLNNGKELLPDTVLLAVGRRLNTDVIGLEELGVAMDEGRIIVDENLQTNLPGIAAAGDVIGGWLLAHVAFAEGMCAAENALGRGAIMDYRVIPRCAFTLPEYGAVGLSEEEAVKHYPVKTARFPFKSLGMGQAMGEPEGLVKIITHAQTDQILGAHIIGPHASDLIGEIALAMKAGLPSQVIMDTIHSHPTLSEAVLEVCQALHGQAIHMPPDVK